MTARALRLVLASLLFCTGFAVTQGLRGKVQLSGKTVVRATGHTVTLTWNANPDATSYNVYRSTTHGGPYTKIASGVSTNSYTDASVASKQQLYYVATTLNGTGESSYSNEAVVSVP